LDALLVARVDGLAGTQRVLALWVAPGVVLALVVLATVVARRRQVRVLDDSPDALDQVAEWGPPAPPATRTGTGPPLIGAVTGWRGDTPTPNADRGPERAGQHVPR
jgi:hypothetical protein